MTEITKHPRPDASTKDLVDSTKLPPKPAETPSVPEIGGPSGLEPTRYGDWERGGRCSDF
jgi:hypothetical protein